MIDFGKQRDYPSDRTAMRQQPCTTCKNDAAGGRNARITRAGVTVAPWLQTLRRPCLPVHTARYAQLQAQGFLPASPSDADMSVFCRTLHAGRRLLYWAAAPVRLRDAAARRGAEHAYGAYENMGVAIAGPSGKVTFVSTFKQPQNY